MAHEDEVAGIGDDEEEEWMIHMQTWWLTLKDKFGACCSRGLGPFFVNLKRQMGNGVVNEGQCLRFALSSNSF